MSGNKKILRLVSAVTSPENKTIDYQGASSSGLITQNSQNLSNLSSTNFNLISSNNLLLTSNFEKNTITRNSGIINSINKSKGRIIP